MYWAEIQRQPNQRTVTETAVEEHKLPRVHSPTPPTPLHLLFACPSPPLLLRGPRHPRPAFRHYFAILSGTRESSERVYLAVVTATPTRNVCSFSFLYFPNSNLKAQRSIGSMEFKFRSVDERPPPPSPSSAVSYFSSEQAAFRGQTAALITSTLAAISTQPNFAPPRTPPPSIFRNPNMRLNLDWAQNPRSVRDELIERQLEKEMIREEIIAAEIARRWALEAEVRRELMLEREIAMRRPAGEGLGFDQDRFGAMRFDHRVYHPFDDDRFGFFASRAPAAFDSFTWWRQPEPLTNGFNSLPAPPPTLDLNNKDKLIILAKPDPNLSGVKRKTPPTVSASELPPFGLKKKPKEEWSCALCHVSATSEKGLIHHINGKKHQAKEARLRAQKPSSSNAQSSKKAANFSEPKKINGIRSTELRAKQVRKSFDHNETSDVSNQKLQEQGTSKKEKEEPPMLKDQCGEVLKNKDEVKMVEGLERKDVKKQKTFKFWCESCKIGAYNLKVWSSHISGKKHIARSQELTQNNIPIASFMASSEASKDAEDTDAAKEVQEKIPTATAISSSEASIEAEDSDVAKEAHQKIPTPTAIPSAEASKDAEDADAAKEAQEKFNGIMIALMRIHNTAVAKEANNSADIAVADTDK